MTLSVIMANYNHATYLPRSLGAILNQSLKPFEVIIIDDLSSDNSIDVIQGFQERYPEIKFHQNIQNMGPTATFNKGLLLATGDYVVFCSADDEVLPGFFEKSLTLLEKHPHIGMSCTDPSFFHEEDVHEGRSCGMGVQERIFDAASVVSILKKSKFRICGHTVIFRRACALRQGGMHDDLKMISDFLLNYLVAFNYGLAYIPEPLASYRITADAYNARMRLNRRRCMQIYRNLLQRISNERKEVQESFRKSRVLADFGILMFFVLCKTPRYWKYIFSMGMLLPKMFIHF